MEFIKAEEIKTLKNEGVASEQLLFPENSESTRVTITRVTIEPGAIQPRHIHDASEQIWIALEGQGVLLLADDTEELFLAGGIARFADGDVHGLYNTSDTVFKYMSITSPPINFRRAYSEETE